MAEVLGLQVDDLPEGWQPVEAVVIIKCLAPEQAKDSSGTSFPYRMCIRVTDGLAVWEVAGLASCVEAEAKQQYITSVEDG